jgi:O-antigen ligase
VTIRSQQRLKGMLVAIAIGATIVAGYGLLQAARLDPLWDDLPNERLFSLVGQPNWLGAFLVLTIPLTLSLIARYRSLFIRGLIVTSVMSQMLVLGGTLSRASWLGLVASFVAGTVLLGAYRLRGVRSSFGTGLRALVAIGILVLVLVFGIRWLPTISLSAIADRASSAVDLDAFDIQQHISLWRVATAIVIDHPLIGTGPDTYAIVFPEYRDQVLEPAYAEYLSRFRPESPHNVYLAYASGAGLFALAAYIVFVLSSLAVIVRTLWRTKPLSVPLLGVLVGLVGHTVTDAFMTMDVVGSWLFWGLAGAAVTVANLEDKPAESPPDSESQSTVD